MARNWSKEEELKWMEEEQREIENDSYLEDAYRGALENGVDTLIGNGGVRLSGGQAQRIALARTLCHKKPVLVLDDPFSALDISTEKKIYNNLCDIAKNNIVIIMTHRLYMFPKMDKVIWMDNGKAIVGTHEEIMLQCPQYRKLYENVSTQMR